MAPQLIFAGAAAVAGLYFARVGLRVVQRMGNAPVGTNYAKGDAKEFLNYVGPFDETVTPGEARLILGVTDGASREEIKRTHRALIMRNHADQGGSPFIARKINESRDALMRK
eukprot:TRINITY_DN36305_c0_g1_i1.p2 TRINITY_DN36305_c0_g1~~TRINITY_DN36305_c0_g1_i1.p2  ORF type:complete len:128 (+),score=52.01 TRINITY_DN36305_c0_g1_i1:46-384(+)